MNLEVDASPQPPAKTQPRLYLDSRFVRQRVAKPARISDLQNYVNGWCSKPLFVGICFSCSRELTPKNPHEFDAGIHKRHFSVSINITEIKEKTNGVKVAGISKNG